MRKRAMVIGLLLVPLATGGAVLLAKSAHQSTPKTKATISLPISEDTPSDYSAGEGSGFVLAPSDATAEPRDLKQQQSEEQQKREAPKQPSSEDTDSDHAATEVLFASESESGSGEIVEGAAPTISSARDFFNSYAFANSRRSSGSAGTGTGTAGHSSGSAPSADSKTPQSTSTSAEEPASTGEPQTSHPQDSDENQPGASDTSQDQSGGSHEETATGNDADESAAEDTPSQTIPVDYFPPADERPHVTVPEPSTLMLLGLGLLACAAASRRRRVKAK